MRQEEGSSITFSACPSKRLPLPHPPSDCAGCYTYETREMDEEVRVVDRIPRAPCAGVRLAVVEECGMRAEESR